MKSYIEAISAIETTTVNMPQATAKNTQMAPAGPPLVRASVPVLRMRVSGANFGCHVKGSSHKGERPRQTHDRGVTNQGDGSVETLERVS